MLFGNVAFGSWLGHEDSIPIMEFVPFEEETRESLSMFVSASKLEDTVKGHSTEDHKAIVHQKSSSSPLIFVFSAFTTVGNKYL